MTLALQQRAVARQEELMPVYRRMALDGAVMVAGLMGLLLYLLVRWSHYLFR
ncbi:MAG TPA: hypothetical protein VK886_01165 [Vicinamibacterales bacterium]|nr:hypothetical protein [Vicinamibacterales bacterium]